MRIIHAKRLMTLENCSRFFLLKLTKDAQLAIGQWAMGKLNEIIMDFYLNIYFSVISKRS